MLAKNLAPERARLKSAVWRHPAEMMPNRVDADLHAVHLAAQKITRLPLENFPQSYRAAWRFQKP